MRGEVVVVGAGITGLTAAHRLSAAGFPVSVLEAADGPGGRVATRAVGAGLMEQGAQFLSTGYGIIPELLQTAGLADQVVNVSGRSMVLGDDRSWRFDLDRPLSFLSSGLLRARDLFPATRGLWATRRLTSRSTNDLWPWSDLDGRGGLDWATERFGSGLTRRLITPSVHGLYFQDLDANSAALPGALLAFSARAASAYTLRGGLGRLPTSLAAKLSVEYGVHVEKVQRPQAGAGRVTLATSSGPREAAAVIMAVPAGPASSMLTDPTAEEAAVMRAPYSPGLLAGLALAEPLGADELGGAYGVLVAPTAPSPLAAIAVHSRADADAAGEVLTVMLRPDAARALMAADDAEVRAAAVDAVAPVIRGLTGRVVDCRVSRWHEAMPSVPTGQAATVQRYRDRLPAGSQVLLAGDYLGFPWTDSAAFNGRWAADRLVHDHAD